MILVRAKYQASPGNKSQDDYDWNEYPDTLSAVISNRCFDPVLVRLTGIIWAAAVSFPIFTFLEWKNRLVVRPNHFIANWFRYWAIFCKHRPPTVEFPSVTTPSTELTGLTRMRSPTCTSSTGISHFLLSVQNSFAILGASPTSATAMDVFLTRLEVFSKRIKVKITPADAWGSSQMRMAFLIHGIVP